MLTAIAASLAIAQEIQDPPRYDMKLIQLVFLNAKADAPKISDEEAGVKQKAHLEYLQSLWEKRTALLVGPLQDAGKHRGLILLDVAKKEEAENIMLEDPWVKAGQLELEIRPWFVARNVPQKAEKFLDIEPYWFGMLMRPSNAPTVSEEEGKKIQEGHMANINKMAEEGALVLAGPIGGDTDFRGIFIFRDRPKEEIEKLAANDPAIQRGRLELKLFRWYTAKGTFPSKK